jgi:hypothetical protein
MTRSRLLAAALAGLVVLQACGELAIEDLQYTVHVSTTETSAGSVVVIVNMADAHRSMVLGPGNLFGDAAGYVGGQYDVTAYVQSTEQLAMLRARRDEIERKLGQADVIAGDLVALANELRSISESIAQVTNGAKSCNGEFKDAAPLPGQGRATVQAIVQSDGTLFLVCN